MKFRIFETRLPQLVIAAYATFALLFHVFNPQGLYFGYGSGGGRCADRGDSFSEYLVGNTVKRNVLQGDTAGLLAIRTRGYATDDYAYYPDGYVKYYSNVVFQTWPATLLAKILMIRTERA